MLLFPGLLLAQSQEQKIDSLKHVIETTENDSVKILALWEWDDLIFMYDAKTDLYINETVYALCTEKIESKTTKSNFYHKFKINAIINLGVINTDKGNFIQSIAYLDEGRIIAKKTGFLASEASIYNNLGNIYLELKNYQNAKENYLKCKKLSEEAGVTYEKTAAISNLGIVYDQLKLKDSSKFYFEQVVEICNEFDDQNKINEYKINSLSALGNAELKNNNIELAEDYFVRSLKAARASGFNKSMGSSLGHMARFKLKIGEPDTAISLATEGLELAEKAAYNPAISSNLETLYKANKKLNRHENALQYYERYEALNDTISNLENQKAAIRQEYKFAYDKKAEQDSLKTIYDNELKDAEIAKRDLEIEGERKQKTGLYIFGVLMLVFVLFLIRSVRAKKRDNLIIKGQQEKVEEQKKKIVDSINYAENIQQSILPEAQEIVKHIPGFNLFYEPKDIVSGDFYWFHQSGSTSYLALSDCTGHGVPGAFMSLIGSTQLKDLIVDSQESDLAAVLEKLDDNIRLLLKQYDEESSEDGMELAIIKLDREKNTLEFAAANQNLFLLKEDIEIVKGTLRSIGGWVRKRSRLPKFEMHTIPLEGVQTVYMTTDGFEDQFGGPNKEKFGRKELQNIMIQQGKKPDMEVFRQALLAWKGDHEQIDDISIIGIQIDS